MTGVRTETTWAAGRGAVPVWLALGGLAIGGGLVLVGQDAAARLVWSAMTAVVLLRLLVSVARALRARQPDVDVIAALAMGGALAAGESLAGAVIAVMLVSGEALDALAQGRAERELSALLHRAPRTAQLLRDGRLVEVDIDVVTVGDRVVVRPGEVVPVDGVLSAEGGVFDQSTLTGESLPVRLGAGDRIRSGVTNVGSEVRLQATAGAADSTYAGIVRLVAQAQQAKAPMVRLADRIAGWFVPLTLLLAGLAWGLSGDPVRALAVLVVATPCPLLLATPIAIVSGISTCARHGVIIKEGGALEVLATARTVCLDKTGTITTGRPVVTEIWTPSDGDAAAAMHLAAAVEQLSTHPFAGAVVAAAGDGALPVPVDVVDAPGQGISGSVNGHRVDVGAASLADPTGQAIGPTGWDEGDATVHVGIDGALAAVLRMVDPLRPEAARAVTALRAGGIDRVVLLTGDRAQVAERIGRAAGVDAVMADRTPPQKVAAVVDEASRARTLMVGDGVNDAPALAVADVGVAMGARGATASSEAAGVVITADSLDGLVHARRIARRARRIAAQSAGVGMGLSAVAMGAAAVGLLTPVAGALLQEGIDVAVILNALRVLREPVS